MILYIYSKCSTCQKALDWIKDRSVAVEVKEITLTPPTKEELENMLTFMEGNLKKLFNTSGLLYKELKLSERLPAMSQDEAISLLSQNGMLVKRPFLIGKKGGALGFKEENWDQFIQSSRLS